MHPIKRYRVNHELTQYEFGARIGVSQTAVSQFEQGTRRPDLFATKRIHDATNGKVSFQDIYPDIFGHRQDSSSDRTA